MTSFTETELDRYAKHLCLPEVGAEGQQQLKKGKVLCVGAGGLGTAALQYLAAAGVGHIGIVDFDKVELSNLQRQILYTVHDIGKLKVNVARERLLALNPHIEIAAFATALTAENVLEILQEYDVIIDATDNFAARYLINDACFHLKKPDVFACILRFVGQCTVFTASKESPCYRCLFPTPPPANLVLNCAEAGVLGALPGLLGSIQAIEALKMLLKIGSTLSGRFLTLDTLNFRWSECHLAQNSECLLCAKKTPFADLERPSFQCQSTIPEISIATFKELRATGAKHFLLDVRSRSEYKEHNLNGYLIPLDELPMRLNELNPNDFIIVHCKMGGRGKKAIQILQEHGFTNAHNLQGGILAWETQT